MTKVSTLKQDNKLSYGIQVKTKGNRREQPTFVIPVMDARDGSPERNVVKQIIKSANQSKFMRPTYGAGGNSYQASQKVHK
jgi:hypothetical protein